MGVPRQIHIAKRVVTALMFAVAMLIHTGALAFKLQPTGTEEEVTVAALENGTPRWLRSVTRWTIDFFSDPVHEELTNRIWGCDARPEDRQTCVSWSGQVAPLIYGVQWNDNPPFAVTSTRVPQCRLNETIRLPDRQPNCWRILFYDAKKHARGIERYDRRSRKALIYRVHFGDMQFLHSMASWDGESMEDTKSRIMMWAEFTYKTALGEIPPTTPVNEVPVEGVKRLFSGNGYDVKILFTRGVPRYRRNIPLVAFGSLMHMIEDSFSKSHVTREPPSSTCPVILSTTKAGRVLEFHAYNRQDPDKHSDADSRNGLEIGLIEREMIAVTVGRKLKEMFDGRQTWEVVRAYLDQCVYEVKNDDLDKAAGPGRNFVR